jgi:hypothetical protein
MKAYLQYVFWLSLLCCARNILSFCKHKSLVLLHLLFCVDCSLLCELYSLLRLLCRLDDHISFGALWFAMSSNTTATDVFLTKSTRESAIDSRIATNTSICSLFVPRPQLWANNPSQTYSTIRKRVRPATWWYALVEFGKGFSLHSRWRSHSGSLKKKKKFKRAVRRGTIRR